MFSAWCDQFLVPSGLENRGNQVIFWSIEMYNLKLLLFPMILFVVNRTFILVNCFEAIVGAIGWNYRCFGSRLELQLR